ncbi:hypothetical protein DJ535_06180 [Citrobacter murliniae]|uniref:Uncharacterized protein n=1 Tax=Citrobacter murliniae TaxID=67829 RepID=A0ABY2PWH7_9ENTR|nr:hypothetical protein DJ535_06180 [Citrobacter murliniae]
MQVTAAQRFLCSNFALSFRYTILNDSANFLCYFFVNRLTLNENPVIVPYAVPGIYPTNCCLTGA